MWSLCTEVAVLPAAAHLRDRAGADPGGTPAAAGSAHDRGDQVAGAGCRSGVAWQAWFAHVPGSEGHYLQWLPGYLPWFLVGMVVRRGQRPPHPAPAPHVLDRMGSDLVGLLDPGDGPVRDRVHAGRRPAHAGACRWAGRRTKGCSTAWPAPSLLPLMFGPELDGPCAHGARRARVAVWLGDISYGVFAIHLFVMGVLFRALRHRAVHRALLDDPGARPRDHVRRWRPLSYRYFEPPILRFKNVRWMMRRELARDARRPRVRAASRTLTLTAATATIAQTWAQ